MIAIILDKEKKFIQSLKGATIISIKNYFNINNESNLVYCIDSENELDGDLVFESNAILVGQRYDLITEEIFSGQFDFEYYANISAKDISDFKVIENLVHIYNGGTIETVPYILPYERKVTKIENKFDIKQTITDFKKYTREEILKM